MQLVLEIKNQNELQLLLQYVKLLQSVKIVSPQTANADDMKVKEPYPKQNAEALQLLEDVTTSYSSSSEPDLDIAEIFTNRTKGDGRKIDFS